MPLATGNGIRDAPYGPVGELEARRHRGDHGDHAVNRRGGSLADPDREVAAVIGKDDLRSRSQRGRVARGNAEADISRSALTRVKTGVLRPTYMPGLHVHRRDLAREGRADARVLQVELGLDELVLRLGDRQLKLGDSLVAALIVLVEGGLGSLEIGLGGGELARGGVEGRGRDARRGRRGPSANRRISGPSRGPTGPTALEGRASDWPGSALSWPICRLILALSRAAWALARASLSWASSSCTTISPAFTQSPETWGTLFTTPGHLGGHLALRDRADDAGSLALGGEEPRLHGDGLDGNDRLLAARVPALPWPAGRRRRPPRPGRAASGGSRCAPAEAAGFEQDERSIRITRPRRSAPAVKFDFIRMLTPTIPLPFRG